MAPAVTRKSGILRRRSRTTTTGSGSATAITTISGTSRGTSGGLRRQWTSYASNSSSSTRIARRSTAKYGNRKTKGFSSKKEAERYQALMLMEKAGLIIRLRTQVPYSILVNDVLVCTYIADFVYVDGDTGGTIVEDAKGFRTRIYRLKAKLMEAVHGIKILET